MIAPLMLRGLWAYRGFVLGSVTREFQSTYSNAVLGALWSLLSPLAMIVVYTVIFSEVMHSRLPGAGDSLYAYSIWLCAGVLTWGLFAEIVLHFRQPVAKRVTFQCPNPVASIVASNALADSLVKILRRGCGALANDDEAIAKLQRTDGHRGARKNVIIFPDDCCINVYWSEARGIQPLGSNFGLNSGFRCAQHWFSPRLLVVRFRFRAAPGLSTLLRQVRVGGCSVMQCSKSRPNVLGWILVRRGVVSAHDRNCDWIERPGLFR